MTANSAEEIVFCLTAADDLRAQIEKLRKEEDYFRWRAASLIASQLDAGKSQRQLAREIGRSQPLVSFMAAVWRRFGSDYLGDGSGNRPFFQDAYRHVQKRRPESLDRMVPLRDDDDDAREAKTACVLLWSDPEALIRPLAERIEAWLKRFKEECPRCGANHLKEAKEYAGKWVVAPLKHLADWVQGDDRPAGMGDEMQQSVARILFATMRFEEVFHSRKCDRPKAQ